MRTIRHKNHSSTDVDFGYINVQLIACVARQDTCMSQSLLLGKNVITANWCQVYASQCDHSIAAKLNKGPPGSNSTNGQSRS